MEGESLIKNKSVCDGVSLYDKNEEDLLNKIHLTTPKLKHDIWIRLFPLKILIQRHYETICLSKHCPPFQLLTFGKLLLNLIKELKQTGQDPTTDSEVQQLLKIFDKLFERILATKFDKDDEYDDFLDLVWKNHSEGETDFTHVPVIERLLKASYSHLENIIEIALNIWNPQYQHLQSTAIMNSYNFQIYLHILHQIYKHHNESLHILNFTIDFLKNIPFHSYEEDSINFYPTEFHSILILISQLPFHLNSNHKIILLQILNLTNDLYKNYQIETHSFISFILKTHKKIFNLIINGSDLGLLTFKQFPFLYQIKLIK